MVLSAVATRLFFWALLAGAEEADVILVSSLRL